RHRLGPRHRRRPPAPHGREPRRRTTATGEGPGGRVVNPLLGLPSLDCRSKIANAVFTALRRYGLLAPCLIPVAPPACELPPGSAGGGGACAELARSTNVRSPAD